MPATQLELYTLGHSAHPIGAFLDLLQAYHILMVADIRSHPASRFHPQFNQGRLVADLKDRGIRYLFLGNDLGGRPKDPACYPGGVLPPRDSKPPILPIYEKMIQREGFTRGIQQLLDTAHQARTAVLCSEENPLACHRHWLIARYLTETQPDVAIWHIRGDGSLVSKDQLRA